MNILYNPFEYLLTRFFILNYRLKSLFLFILFSILFSSVYSQVSVTATAGTTGPTSYTTLNNAFAAINAGTHQGNITISITANTTETGACVLNSSGAGSASYTSVTIRPTNDGVTISGPTVTGRGLIELNGADNVTIDGDNPNTSGINRNLTITNTAATSVTFTCVIRIATSTLITTADNITIKNCILNGSGNSFNSSANTSFTATQGGTSGIFVGAGASTSSATTAPTALSANVNNSASGQTFANLTIDNNTINSCGKGIAVCGAATNNCPVLTISNNIIGNPTAGNANQVYWRGIYATGFGSSSGSQIFGNTLYVESFCGSTSAPYGVFGIDLGGVTTLSTAQAGTTIQIAKNKILRVKQNNTGGYPAVGINLQVGNGVDVINNFITNVINVGSASFSSTYAAQGIRVHTGNNHKIYHNSIHLTGSDAGTGNIISCLSFLGTGTTGCDVRNNIFSNVCTSASTSSSFVGVYFTVAPTSGMALTMNNNAYYTGNTSGLHGIGQVSTTKSSANLYTASNFVASATTPSTNWRAITSVSVSSNDNASIASTSSAPFTSSSDLHLNNNATNFSDVDDKGANLSITTDIDDEARSATPDIGADEYIAPIAPIVNSFSPSSGCSNVDSVVITGQNFTGITAVQIGGTNVAGYVVRSQTEIRALIGSGTTGVITVTNPSGSGSSSGNFTVNITPSVSPIGGGASTVCVSANSPAFTNATSGGSWSVTNGPGSASISSGGVLTGITVGTVTVNYTVTSGSCSNTATTAVTVVTVPSITTNPSNASVVTGNNTSFTVAASSSPSSYIWEVNDGNGWTAISNGGVYSNATTATLNLTSVPYSMNGYQYRATAVNGCGNSSPSTAATLTVNYCGAPLTTTVNGVDIITRMVLRNTVGDSLVQNSTSNGTNNYDIYNNTPLNLEIGSTGNILRLTFGTDGSQASAAWIDFNRNGVFESSENIALSTVLAGSGATVTYTFSVPSGASAGVARIRVRGGADAVGNYTAGGACSVTPFGETEDYLVNFYAPASPTISSFTPTTLCSGGGESVTITGTNFLGASSVQFNGVNASSYTVVSSTSITAVTPSGLTAGVISVTTAGGTATSTTYTVNPTPNPNGGGSTTVCVSGTSPAFTNSTGGGVWSIINGTGSATINSSGVVTGVSVGTVTVVYTVGGCSRTSTMTVVTVPSITSNPTNATVVAGGNTSFTAVGNSSPTSYIWEVNDGSGWTTVTNGGVYSNATTGTLNLTNVTLDMSGYQYRAIAVNGCGNSSPSSAATLTVNYCSPTYTSGCTLGSRINNFSTTGANTNITNNGTGCASGGTGYSNYTSTHIASADRSQTVNFSVGVQSYNGGVKIWVDWNRNGIFESGELMAESSAVITAGNTFTGSFQVPAGASLGTTRMRVRVVEGSTSFDACSNYSYGETEDYGFTVTIPAANDAGITGLVTTAFCPGSQSVQVVLRNYGTATLTSATINWSVNGVNQTPFNWTGSLATNSTENVAVGSFTFVGATNYVIVASSSNPNGVADEKPSNDSYTSPTFQTALSGTYTVGTGGDFTTLTAAVASAVSNGLCGPTVFSLTNTTYSGSETFPITIPALNGSSSTNTLTIRPAASNNATISGSNTTAILRINGGDNIIIDGSNNGTNSKNLTIQNTNSGTSSAVIWISSTASDGCTNNIIKNCTTIGNASTTTYGGIVLSGSTIGGDAQVANNNITIENNTVTKSTRGIFVAGSSSGQTGLQILNNTIGSATAADYVGTLGMFLKNCTGAVVNNNNIFNIVTSSSTNPIGIDISTNVLNSSFNANRINEVRYTGTGGYGGKGMNINTGSATSNLTLTNNMISNIGGDGWSSLTGDGIVGVRIGATGGSNVTTGGINFYNNTIHLSGSFNGNSSGSLSAALFLSATTSNLNIVNNILSSTLDNTAITTDKTYAIYSAVANSAFSSINYNNYFVSGVPGVLGYLSSDRIDIAGIQAGFGSNTNSQNIQPFFVSATDIHLDVNNNAILDNLGTFIASVTTDYDVELRSTTTPDIGADEFTTPNCSGSNGGTATYAGSPICISGSAVVTASGYSAGTGASYQWQYSSDNFVADINDIPGQTNPTFLQTPTIFFTTYFRLKVTCSFTSSTGYSTSAMVTVNNPVITGTTSAERCGAGTLTLSATGSVGSTIKWYDAATGGTQVGTGATYTTPSLSTTKTYYVAASNSATENVGIPPTGNACGNLSASFATDWPLRFNTTQSVTINSVYIIPSSTGTVTIALRNAGSAVNIATVTTANYTSGQVGVPQLVNLNFNIPSAGSYQLTNTAGYIYRIPTYTCSFPISNSTGTFSIVGSALFSTTGTVTDYYNSFFNLSVTFGCESNRTAVTATISNPVTKPNITPVTDITRCSDDAASLITVSGSTATDSSLILFEDFNGTAPGWTNTNAGLGGGYPADASWKIVPANYTFLDWSFSNYFSFFSNDNTKFYISNSDDQLGSSSVANTTILYSPEFSTVGYSSALLSFYHNYEYYDGNESGNVEISIDGGTNWSNLATYTSDEGTVTYTGGWWIYDYDVTFTRVSIDLSAYLNQPTVKLRFRYVHTFDWWWAIDNVSIKGVKIPKYVWSPATGLYTDAAATIAYNPVTMPNVNTVYAKPTDTTTYVVTAYIDVATSACAAKDTITVNVSTVPNGTINTPVVYACDASAKLSATINPASSALTWTRTSGTGVASTTGNPATATGLAGTTVYQLSATNGACVNRVIGNTSVTTPTTTNTIIATSPSPGAAVCNFCVYQNGNTKTYYNSTNGRIIASITDEATIPSYLDETELCFKVEGSVQTITDNLLNQQPYLPRVWTIKPATGTRSIVTLYFTQSELNALLAAANTPGNPYQFSGYNGLYVTKYPNGGNGVFTPPGSPGGVSVPSTFSSFNTNDHKVEFVVDDFSTFYIHPVLFPFAALPVELISFTGWNDGAVNQLQWKTASESNTLKFVVEKSKDGINFSYIGEKPAAGNSNQLLTYNFTDAQPFIGNNYYRLKIIDNDGSFAYSNIVNIVLKTPLTNQIVSVYPNPTNGILTVEVESITDFTTNVMIYNILGEVVNQQTVDFTKGLNTVQFNFSSLSNATYILQFTDNTNKPHQYKFIKH